MILFQGNKSTVFSVFKSYLNKGHERSINLKKNILATFIMRLLSIAISLVMVPMTLGYVNPVQYGIWITLSSIVGWLGYFDIGFGNGLRNRFAESVALDENRMAKVYVSTTYAIMFFIILFLITVILILNPHLNWSVILNAPGNMRPQLADLALIVIVFFCFQLLLQLLATVLTANQQPAKASLLTLIANAVTLLSIFILTKTTSGNLIYLGIAISAPPVIVLLISSLWFYTHRYAQFSPSISYIDLRYVPNLMGLGIKFFILQIATLVLYQTSNLIIAQLFGSENVTIYNIAFKYFNIIPMVMLIVMMPMWSAFTDAWTRKELDWITKTIRKLNYLWGILGVVVLIMLAFSDFVYKIWIGDEIKVPFGVSLALSLSIIINIGAYIYSIFLNGTGIIKLQLILAIFGMAVFIPSAVFLGKRIGLPGVILSTIIVNTLNLIFFLIQYKKIINSSASGIWSK